MNRKACMAVTNHCSYFRLYEAHMSVMLPRLRVCVDRHEESLRPTAVSRSLPIVIRHPSNAACKKKIQPDEKTHNGSTCLEITVGVQELKDVKINLHVSNPEVRCKPCNRIDLCQGAIPLGGLSHQTKARNTAASQIGGGWANPVAIIRK